MADSIIQQLYQRKMFRITAAYLAVAWVLWQVVGTTCPAFECSMQFQQSIFWFLIGGLPVTLAIAWVNWKTAILVGTGLLAGAALMFFMMRGPATETNTVAITPRPQITQSTTTTATDIGEKSVAVLPFVNMSTDPEQEYFSDGISEEILNALVHVKNLRVAARTSSFYFKGKKESLQTVGDALKVSHILEGSVRKAGNQLRITAQLIKVDDGFHLWSESYDRELTDIFAIQEEIAQAVVEKLEVVLGIAAEGPLVKTGTVNTDAYNWYLKGRYHVERQTPEAFENSVNAFKKAITFDPEFAGGYGGLGYAATYWAIVATDAELAEQGRAATTRALKLDENQTDALLAKALDLAVDRYEFATVERLLQKALASAANKTLIADSWFILLAPQRRFDEALALLELAEKEDPLSPLVMQGIGKILVWQGRYEEALMRYEQALELNPNDMIVLSSAPIVQAKLGRYDDAAKSLQRLREVLGDEHEFSLYATAMVHIAKGERSEAERIRRRQINYYNLGHADWAKYIGDVTLNLGDIEEAIDWYERASEVHNFVKLWIPLGKTDNTALWEHPRFQALLKKMNLDDASITAMKAGE